MRYFMRLAYRGANFHGWQTQPIESSNTNNDWTMNSMRSSDLHFFSILTISGCIKAIALHRLIGLL